VNTCACGNSIDGNGTTCQRCAALNELGLKAAATDAEVKTAYRLNVKAWHPDRFPGDDKSKHAAQEKLKTINSAYDFLNSPSSRKGQTYRPKAATPPTQPQEPTKQKQSSAKQPPPAGGRNQEPPPRPNTGGQVPPRPPNSPPPPPSGAWAAPSQNWQHHRHVAAFTQRLAGWTSSPWLRTFLRYAVFVCVVGLGKLFWQSFDTKPTAKFPAQAEWEKQVTKAQQEQRSIAVRALQGQMASPVAESNPRIGSVYDLGRESYNHKNYVSARSQFTQACDAGEMKACNYLGYLYARGLGGDQDREKARDVYQRACDHKDDARMYFQKACDGGVNEACNLLRGIR
jgi:curved DNA-binding protein CbpA